LPVGAPEAQLAVGLSLDLIALFVHRAMMPPTEHGEIRQLRWAAMRPVLDVMALAEWQPAAREATAFVSMLKRTP
jgi:hypothetical protein